MKERQMQRLEYMKRNGKKYRRTLQQSMKPKELETNRLRIKSIASLSLYYFSLVLVNAFNGNNG